MNKNKILPAAFGLLGCALAGIVLLKPIAENSASASGVGDVTSIDVSDGNFSGSVNVASLGRGIDVVKGDSLYYSSTTNKAFRKILNDDYLINLFENEGFFSSTYEGDNMISEIEKSFYSLSTRVCTSETNSGSVGASYGPYSGDLKASFSMSNDTSYANSVSSVFYYGKYTSIKGTYGFGNINILDEYRDNLNSAYVSDLTRALHGDKKMTWDNFFGMYGTHLAVSADIGASYEISYKCYSNKNSFSSETVKATKAGIEGSAMVNGVTGKISDENDFQMKEILNTENDDFVEKTLIKSHGGPSFALVSFKDAKVYIENWFNEVNNNQKLTICRYIDKIPLWDIIPSALLDENELYCEVMETAFTNYKDNHDKEVQAISLSDWLTDSSKTFFQEKQRVGTKPKTNSVWWWIGAAAAVILSGGFLLPGIIDTAVAGAAVAGGITTEIINGTTEAGVLVSQGYCVGFSEIRDLNAVMEHDFDRVDVSVTFNAYEANNGVEKITLYNNIDTLTGNMYSSNYYLTSKTFKLGGDSLLKEQTTQTVEFKGILLKDLLQYKTLLIEFTADDDKANYYVKDAVINFKYVKKAKLIKPVC